MASCATAVIMFFLHLQPFLAPGDYGAASSFSSIAPATCPPPKRAGAKARSEASGSAVARTPTPPLSEASSGSSGRGIAALATTSETKARQVTSQIDELLAAQKRARLEKKRLANKVKKPHAASSV